MTVADTTRYEVSVTFEIDQPTSLGLSQDEVCDNVTMDLEQLQHIGFARIDAESICVAVKEVTK